MNREKKDNHSGKNSLFQEIFACPQCHSNMISIDNSLICEKCKDQFLINDKIPSFLPRRITDHKILLAINGWANISWDYDEKITKTNKHLMRSIDSPLIHYCKKNNLVLEIGCGTARLSDAIAAKKCTYIGIDPSLFLLNQGIIKNRTSLLQGIGEFLPFKDGCFDVIIGGYHSFRYIQFRKCLEECARTTKPGGHLVFTLWNGWSLLASSFKFKNLIFNSYLKSILTKNLGTCNDVFSPYHIIKTIESSGFKVQKILSTKKDFPFLKAKPSRSIRYWHGVIGAFFGHNIIFICQKK